ncbi:hypothetical protein GCM10009133_38890 [Cocleimonas flava]|uniref:Polysaccharide lyase 14 domain-containing protein n=1 Tax=Cocleimonas flava TaxID=634765 RepID=A0A4R1F3B8_9GAMM|nr:hypothetical protein [Cocleimonas flava]TCJ88273.1 hypothetical protein EV695_0113 [Cocleimonas flava]
MFPRFLLLLPLFATHSLFASPDFCSEQQEPKPIFCQDFENRETGLYTEEDLVEDWPNLQSLSTKVHFLNLGVSQNRVNVVDRKIDENDNHILKIKYPENLFGSALTGATWVMKFPEKYEQLSLEYKVMFKEGFLYDREGLFGGKLPGLMGGETISGGATANGKNGWTSRIMWGQLGRGLGYLYYPDMRDDKYNQDACPRYGLDHELCVIKRNKYFTFDDDSSKKCLSEWAADEFEFRFKTERFYKIKQFIKMNTLPEKNTDSVTTEDKVATTDKIAEGNRDGQLKIWLDDKLVVDCNNIRFRDVPELSIDSLLFSTFFGGNTPESSSHPHDEYIYFDDFVVREN